MERLKQSNAIANVLFVDDDEHVLSSLKRLMRRLDINCEFANSGEQALEILQGQSFDVVISDMRMPHMNGAELLAIVADKYPETIRMVLSGHSDMDMVLAAINEGKIWSYISKPWEDKHLCLTIENAVFTQQLIAERALLRHTLDQYHLNQKDQFQDFIGSSMSMQFIYNALERAAPSKASVFITGESGTGKELAARAIHDLSPRANKEFVALNCAAIPSELMESEIFGHVKGSFSGAVSNRDGAASLADGGTLFLDELGEMDIGLQAKLLRFIQTGSFQKVGSSQTQTVDIRFVCATNRNPLEAIENNKLREDLYYRLNVISIDLPSLAQRDDDALLLARTFLQNFAQQEEKMVVGFAKQAEQLICQYNWPGNVRQLENTMHSCVVMAQGPLIDVMDLALSLNLNAEQIDELLKQAGLETNAQPQQNAQQAPAVGQQGNNVVAFKAEPQPMAIEQIKPLSEVERVAIENAIRLCEDNVVKAASLLEVSPSTLYRKMQNWKDD